MSEARRAWRAAGLLLHAAAAHAAPLAAAEVVRAVGILAPVSLNGIAAGAIGIRTCAANGADGAALLPVFHGLLAAALTRDGFAKALLHVGKEVKVARGGDSWRRCGRVLLAGSGQRSPVPLSHPPASPHR